MAIEFADSCGNGYSTVFQIYQPNAQGTPSVSAGNGRRGDNCIRAANSQGGFILGGFLANAATRWMHAGIKLTNTPASERAILALMDGSSVQASITSDNDGFLRMRLGQGGAVLAGPTMAPLDQDTYHWWAFGGTIDNSTGSLALWVDGVEVLAFGPGDTQNTGNSHSNGVRYGGDTQSASTATIDYTDVVVATSRMADQACYAVLPSGNGDSSDFVGSDADSTDNYLLVDEAVPDADTTYVESDTPTDEDLYAMADLSLSSGSIGAVVVYKRARKDDSGSRTMRSAVKLPGSTSNGASTALTTDYLTTYDVFTAKPGGGAWATADVDDMQVGVEIDS